MLVIYFSLNFDYSGVQCDGQHLEASMYSLISGIAFGNCEKCDAATGECTMCPIGFVVTDDGYFCECEQDYFLNPITSICSLIFSVLI
jgi:hypothetical protein